MCRGSPDRNAASAGGTPLLNRRWAVSSINDPRLEKLLEQVRQSYVDQSTASLPDSQPLAVGDLIIARSVAGLVAIDFRTGKRLWRGPTDEAVKAVLDTQSVDRATADPSLLSVWLDQRWLGDATYGTLSSDGRLVFCVEDVGTGFNADRMMTIIPPTAACGCRARPAARPIAWPRTKLLRKANWSGSCRPTNARTWPGPFSWVRRSPWPIGCMP